MIKAVSYTHLPQALKLLAQSAEAGNEFASYTLGKTFLEGKEVAKDIPRAITYLEQAVNKDLSLIHILSRISGRRLDPCAP